MSELLKNIHDGVATLTLNRPQQYNALCDSLLDEISAELDSLAADESVRVVVITGNGKAFCAGHDLKQMRANDNHPYQHDLFSRCSAMMQKIANLPQPVIAKVQGMATAAGCQLVATCDLAVAVDTAQFAVSGVRVGLFCSTPAVALSRNISRKRAMQLLLTGDFIDAHTALDFGLINEVASTDQLDATVDALAARIKDKPARVITLGKKMFYEQLNQPLADAYSCATDAISGNMMMKETKEGIDAFLEKRKPDWDDYL